MSDLIEQEFMEPERLMTEQELRAYEFTIERGIQTYIEVGSALKKIRDQKGYRFTHATFADYVESRWKMSVRSAYNNISASQMVENVHPGAQIGFKQAVAIGTLEADQQREFVAMHDVPNMTKRETEEAVNKWKLRAEEAERQLQQARRETIVTQQQAQSLIERDRQLREENERLKAQKNPEPKVIEKPVEVYPPDYRLLETENRKLKMSNDSLRAEMEVIKNPILSNQFEVKKRKQDLNRDARALASKVEMFIKDIAPLAYLSRLIVDADSDIRNEYEEALSILERWIFDVRQNIKQTSAQRSAEVIDIESLEVETV